MGYHVDWSDTQMPRVEECSLDCMTLHDASVKVLNHHLVAIRVHMYEIERLLADMPEWRTTQ